MKKIWHLSVDTGGTFTDCIARSPKGITRYIKVLSSGRVGGRILQVTDEKSVTTGISTQLVDDLFAGYTFVIPVISWQSNVIHNDSTGNFTLQDALPANLSLTGTIIYLTAFEEAPILAARVATQTPLKETLPTLQFRLGTTKGTNALLEGKGSKTALVVNKGFKDLLAIGTQQRPELFALNIIKRQVLAETIIEIDEYTNSDGKIKQPLLPKSINKCIEEISLSGCKSIAISLKNSYKNPANEQMLANAITQANCAPITCSAVLYPAIKYLTRTETAVVNAYLKPVLGKYLENIASHIHKGNIRVMTSAGALAKLNMFNAKDSLLSGPAGGIVGAAKAAQMAGFTKVLTIDMGGTSTDVSRYDQGYDYTTELSVGEARLFTQALAIETVAAGGGSVCYVDDGHLYVGPESAGADPGPACYGNSGPLTITDLNLLSGRVSADDFGIPLDLDQAHKEMDNTLKALCKTHPDSTYDRLLIGFLTIANQKMADAVKKISINKGFDPKEYALLGFGGAVGQHICDIATLLNVKNIVIPYNGSLLSAVGISKAVIKRHEIKQILQPLRNVDYIKTEINLLQQKTLALIEKDGVENPVISQTDIFMRLYGQDTSIELSYTTYDSLQEQFKEKYLNLFGHWVDREIEVESIRVTVSEPEYQSSLDKKNPESGDHSLNCTGTRSILYNDGWVDTPLYSWPEFMGESRTLSGPVVLYNPFTSIIINPGWKVKVDDHHLLISEDEQHRLIEDNTSIKAVALALFTNRFKSVAEQMGSLLQRTALSVNIKERLDFSCALLDKNGRLVVNAPHIPVHLGSLGICTRSVVKNISLNEGDVVITNHPAYGGSHLPDVTLIAPIYYQKELVGYLANRAHHAEIGGKAPGSMPADARSLAEEGVVIPPTLVIKNGQADWPNLQDILCNAPYPTRSIEDNMADFEAALASIIEGQKVMGKLLQVHGKDTIIHFMQLLSEQATTKLQEKLQALNINKLIAKEHLDDGSVINVHLTYHKNRLIIDFSGTSETNKGNLNATEAIVNGAVLYVLKLLIGGNIPLNEGLMQDVELIIPPGSLLNPVFSEDINDCPAVVGGNTEVSQRLVDTLLKAFGLAACSQGTMNNFLFGNDKFGYYETIGGGTGAGFGFNGADAVHQHMTNTRITDPEILEFRYPVELKEFSIRSGSGGKGHWQGGNGIRRTFLFKEPVIITFLTQHRKINPYGLAGGKPGKTGKQFLIKANKQEIRLAGIGTYKVNASEIITIETPGGGGYGDEK